MARALSALVVMALVGIGAPATAAQRRSPIIFIPGAHSQGLGEGVGGGRRANLARRGSAAPGRPAAPSSPPPAGYYGSTLEAKYSFTAATAPPACTCAGANATRDCSTGGGWRKLWVGDDELGLPTPGLCWLHKMGLSVVNGT